MRGRYERKKKRCEAESEYVSGGWRVAECHSKLGGEDKQQPQEPAEQYTSETLLRYIVRIVVGSKQWQHLWNGWLAQLLRVNRGSYSGVLGRAGHKSFSLYSTLAPSGLQVLCV